MFLSFILMGVVGAILLACDCCTPKERPQVTAVEEELSREETLHRLRQFHGHIGPYALLGYRLGLWLLERLGCSKYFGASVTVRGPGQTPFTCMLDGLQMATGYTLGKGNLQLIPGGAAGAGVLFDVEVTTETGHYLKLEVPAQVGDRFADWMAQELSEPDIFDKVMAEPMSSLWQEKS